MARTIDPFTGSKGYQGRSFEDEAAGPMTIDPFAGGENIRKLQRFAGDVQDYGAQLRLQNAPVMDRSMPAIVNVPLESVPREGLSMPRSRGPAPRVEAPTGRAGRSAPMRAQPVSFGPTLGERVPDFAAERARYTVPIPLYKGEDVRVAPSAMRGQREQVQLTPEQQAIIDAFWDEQARWTATDEMGRTVHRGTRYGGDMMDIGTQRMIQQVEAEDAMRAAELEAARQAARPKPRVRI